MGLEKDIQQASFTGQRQKAVINLIYTYHWITEQIRTILGEEDITLQQYNILRILRGSDPRPLSTLTIRERMLDKMSDTSRIVDRLVLKGLVSKRMCPTDKRLVDVVITKQGKALLLRIDTKDPEMNAVMHNLSDAELEMLNALLDKLRGSID
jgi:MarR family transcriptional regulator, 2-MHQ and catechol-resistance regulon repressor